MDKFETFSGLLAPLDAQHADTDQIIPKQFLKRVERTGYGEFLFFDWRFNDDGSLNHDFEMNHDRYQGASILIARDNFGCGSSREHAPWALKGYGIRCIVAPSFADIFYNNCFNNGLLPVVLEADTVDRLFGELRANEGYALKVDLERRLLLTPSGEEIPFELDDFLRDRLLNGWDQVGLTLRHEDAITRWEKDHDID
jgi:3-isopropylmalate/(R)-2-methylmalate dehydratase small subunit